MTPTTRDPLVQTGFCLSGDHDRCPGEGVGQLADPCGCPCHAEPVEQVIGNCVQCPFSDFDRRRDAYQCMRDEEERLVGPDDWHKAPPEWCPLREAPIVLKLPMHRRTGRVA